MTTVRSAWAHPAAAAGHSASEATVRSAWAHRMHRVRELLGRLTEVVARAHRIHRVRDLPEFHLILQRCCAHDTSR
uniref:Uncharacterized protein n=1 Tax=Thermocrispum agreste TaxID=37925 RepID=A0A2W4JI78_9PSEU|nr:MAG: hypothetical protein DIU77_08745 [Thermocrispum agreste]